MGAMAAIQIPDASWQPSTGLPFGGGRKAGSAASSSTAWRVRVSRDGDELSKTLPAVRSLWKREKEEGLVQGLFVPPVDPRKQKKLTKKNVKETAGKQWFDMPAATLTPEMKRELNLVKLRGVLDPKRHYKANDSKSTPKFLQVGTVVEGAADFYSGRLTKKERKLTFADELLTDSSLQTYRKRKYLQIQEQQEAGGKKFWKKKKNRQKPSWAKS